MAIVVDQLVTEFVAKDGVSGPAKSMTGAIGGMASSIPAATAALVAFGGAVAVAAAGGIANLGERAIRASAEIGQLKLALGTVSDQPDKQFERLTSISNELGADIEALTMSFVGLRAAGAEMGLAERAVRSFANAARTVPNSTAALQQAFLGLRQIQSSDIIQGEEIKQITEALPQAAKVLKDAFGTIKGEDMRAQGVGPTEFVDALIAGMEKLPVAAGGATLAWTRFDNAVKLSFAQAGDSLNDKFSPMIDKVTDALIKLGEDGGVIDRIGEKWANLFSPEVQTGMLGVLALLIGTLEAIPSAIQRVAKEIVWLMNAIKSMNPVAVAMAGAYLINPADNFMAFTQDVGENTARIMGEMMMPSSKGVPDQDAQDQSNPTVKSLKTLEKIERNTRPLLDFRQYVLGDGELGAAGVTPTEIAGLKGMKSRSKVESAVWALVSAIKDDAKIEALKAMGSTKRMGAAR